MSIGEICNREVVITDKNSSLRDIAKLMRRHHVGTVVVAQRQDEQVVPVGIVTDRDLVIEGLARDVEPDTITAGELMADELFSVHEVDSVWDTIKFMRGKGVRRAPVVDDQGGLQGIITIDDLLELISEEMFDLAKLVRREQTRELLRHK
jgi:CBS domain-containing protein